MAEEPQVYVDGESQGNYFSNQEMSFRSILLTHLARIMKISSQEFHGGYFRRIQKLMGHSVSYDEYYVPNTREEYINSINALSDILLPYFDDDMVNAEERLIKEEKDMGKRINEKAVEKKWSSDKYTTTISEETVSIKRELFRELSKFLKRKNYLELGELEDA